MFDLVYLKKPKMKQIVCAIKRRLSCQSGFPLDSEHVELNFNCLESLEARRDQLDSPFFWSEIHSFVPEKFYNALCTEYPKLHLFDKHVGIPRGLQKPHDRYYLALNWGPYSTRNNFFANKGIVKKRNLPAAWKVFIAKLEGPEYRRFICRLFEVEKVKLRFAWHMGFTGAEISPHVDAPIKLGTHIFYFNPEGQWDPLWGGQTVLLGNLKKHIENPEFSDFGSFWNASNIGNTSLIWRNSPLAWHGVRPLNAPEGCFRKIFTVVIDRG